MMKKRFSFILITLFLINTIEVFGQEISFSNYPEKLKEVKKLMVDENYNKAVLLLLKLNDYLETRHDISKDSINHLFSVNYYNLCNIYLFEDQEKSRIYSDSAIAKALLTTKPKLKQKAFSIKYYTLYYEEGKEATLDYLADQCIMYSKKAKDDKLLAESYMHKCNSQAELGKVSQAIVYCDHAVDILKKISEPGYLNTVYNNIGNVFSKIDEHKKALWYYKKSHEIALQRKGARAVSRSARNIAEKNELLGNWETAAQYFRVYGDSTESYYKKLIDSKFAEAEEIYNTEKKDKEIAQKQLEITKQKSIRNKWIFGSLGFILIGFSLFQWRNNKQKREKLLAENKYKNEQEINELRTKFLANISHEIRTPLTLISGNLILAKENISNQDKALKNIDVALLNSKKVVEDANGILELLKFEKNKTTLKLSQIRLNETLKRIFLSFTSLADMKDIKLKYHTTISENISIKTDIEKLEKILNNLISNAIKYSPSKSKIIFDTSTNNEMLTVKLIDFGQGILFNETEKIFERFYQSSDSKAVGGIGIGLSLAKEFAELLDGSLSVESEFSKGSTFVFTVPIDEISHSDNLEIRNEKPPVEIPINEEQEIKQSAINNTKELERLQRQEAPRKDKPKVLIVEDNPEMCAYIVEILSDNYDCTTAFDGQEALSIIEKQAFDLITSDIMMPKLDGFQLRERLNKNDIFKNIPFILISAKTLEEDKVKGFNLGIDDYIVKPFNKNELIARINNLLENKISRAQWRPQNKELDINIVSSEKKLIKKAEAIVIKNISDEYFKVAQLASEIGYSQRQLSRLLNHYTGMSPVKFILEIRLQRAYKTLQNKIFFTLSEVRYDVGIVSSSYFNKKFKERFGINPSEFLS